MLNGVINKKAFLILGLFGSLLGIILRHPVTFGICTQKYTTANYIGCLDNLSQTLSDIFIPIFLTSVIFSIITLKLRDEVFRSWMHFAILWIPLSIFMILMAPDHGGGTLYPTAREMLAIICPALFLIISSGIIVYKWYSLKDKKTK